MLALILILGAVAWVVCLPLSALMRYVSLRMGLVDQPGSEAHKAAPAGWGGRPRPNPVPNTGGIAVFAAIAWPMLAVLLGVWLIPETAWHHLPRGEVVLEHLAGLQATSQIGGGILVALAIMHLLGVYDDRRALGPGVKLSAQIAVAAGLVGFCDIRVLSFLEGPELGLPPMLGSMVVFLISLVWIVVVTNAMNFLDNMDGLATGVGLVAGGLYLAATLLGGQWFVAGLAALLCGSLLAFWGFNLPPAKMYLGDGGSLVIGLLLAVISVRTTYINLPVEPGGFGEPQVLAPAVGWYGALMPVLVLAVPLYDFTSVTLIRILNGKSPFTGDHNHFSHRLLRRGLTKRKALAVILLTALATGLGGVMLSALEGWQAAVVATQAAAVLAVLALLESDKRQI